MVRTNKRRRGREQIDQKNIVIIIGKSKKVEKYICQFKRWGVVCGRVDLG